MEESIIEKKYGIIDELLNEVNEKRELLKSKREEESFQPIFHMYDVMEENALFIRNEIRNSVAPAFEEIIMLADKLENNDGKLTKHEIKIGRNTFLKISFELGCLDTMFELNSELLAGCYCDHLRAYVREPELSEMIEKYSIGPDVDFDEIPGLPSILNVYDFEGFANRIEWLINHYHNNKYAKIYLNARRDVCEKYKEQVKMVPVSVHAESAFP